MAQWLHGCEICNAGLCAEMDALLASGLSQRQAAKSLEAIQQRRLGEVVYSSEALRRRYNHNKPRVVQNAPPHSSGTDTDSKATIEEESKQEPPP